MIFEVPSNPNHSMILCLALALRGVRRPADSHGAPLPAGICGELRIRAWDQHGWGPCSPGGEDGPNWGEMARLDTISFGG